MFDLSHPTLRRRLDRGDCIGLVWLSLGSVALCEIAARARPDAIVLDMQHGAWDHAGLTHAIGLVPPDVPVLVRVGENTALAISRALDAGAEGVIVPMVDCAEDAARAVSACRFPPLGTRSGGGIRPLADFPAYVKAAERGIVLCVMVETAQAVAEAPAIAAVPGIDAVFIGTGDLALSLGCSPGPNTRHEEACQAVLKACSERRVPCGRFTLSTDAALARREEGFRMIVVENDIDLAARGFSASVRRFSGGAGSPPAHP